MKLYIIYLRDYIIFLHLNTEAELIELAKSWTKNIDELQSIRHQLRGRMQSGVMKPENVARGFEKGLTMMWQRFCSGLPVKSFSVPKDEG